jgi:hypothetical protein
MRKNQQEPRSPVTLSLSMPEKIENSETTCSKKLWANEIVFQQKTSDMKSVNSAPLSAITFEFNLSIYTHRMGAGKMGDVSIRDYTH